jgi:YgiT-type zinc finger domain-containing protein
VAEEVISCPKCGQAMRPATVKTAIWRDDHLFVVEDIPAQVCDSCMDQFYDDDTTEALRRLTEEGFTSIQPEREALVPIFSLKSRIRRRAPSSSDELPVDY